MELVKRDLPLPAIGFSILLAALLLVIGKNENWVQWLAYLGISVVYLFVCLNPVTANLRNHPLGWVVHLLLAVFIILLFITRSNLTAIYLTGGALLMMLFLCAYFSHKKLTEFRSAIGIISVFIIFALIAKPITISRIVLDLKDMPVPSKIALQSDPDAPLQRFSQRTYPMHSLFPLRVRLNAGNISHDSPMPWLRFQVQRASHFIIHRITYKFLTIRLHQLKSDELHSLSISDKSDEATLVKLDNGIRILDITSDESVWVPLPNLDNVTFSAGTVAQVIGLKVIIWGLIVFSFICLAPMAGSVAAGGRKNDS